MFDSPDHDMVASFMLEKPVSLLQDNILQLEGDILDEIEAPTIKVSAVPYFISILVLGLTLHPPLDPI